MSGAFALTHRGQLVPFVFDRLAKAVGPKRAADLMRDTFVQFGNAPLDSAQDLLSFANLLVKSAGLVQVVGRALKVQALLRGAVE